MSDVHSKAVRSKNMRMIRSKNTKPEKYIRSLLHREGFRFRIHRKDLPSTPDIFLPKYQAVILISSCFFHGHGCYLFTWPKSHCEYWYKKITNNRVRDQRDLRELNIRGIKVLTIWTCAMKGKKKLTERFLLRQMSNWLISSPVNSELSWLGMRVSNSCF